MLKSNITREEVAGALGPVWDWYQSDEYKRRPLYEILKDISVDLQRDREVALKAFRLVKAHDEHMTVDARPMDKVQHELNSLRSVIIGLRAVLK